MKKIDLGQTITIFANIGIIASIVFLAIEVRDNATQARVATTIDALLGFSVWENMIASDPQLTNVYVSGMRDFDSLSQAEQAQFDFLMRSFIRTGLGNAMARASGLVPMSEDPGERNWEGGLLRMINQPGFRQWWSTADLRGIPAPAVNTVEALQQSSVIE